MLAKSITVNRPVPPFDEPDATWARELLASRANRNPKENQP